MQLIHRKYSDENHINYSPETSSAHFEEQKLLDMPENSLPQ